MIEKSFNSRFHDRTVRYAGRTLEQIDPVYLSWDYSMGLPSTMHTVELLIGLLVRMGAPVELDPQNASGESLDKLISKATAANPSGSIFTRGSVTSGMHVHIGNEPSSSVDLYVLGVGWNAYCGKAAPNMETYALDNCMGGSLAAIIAAARIYYGHEPYEDLVLNAYDWSCTERLVEVLPSHRVAQNIWFVGCGSVGSSAAYFLATQSEEFQAHLIDGDIVGVENIARSPIFTSSMIGMHKSESVSNWLTNRGITATYSNDFLDNNEWLGRPTGTPDVLVSAANEFNVRSKIENGAPPLQIYGTTGRNNQCAVLRHEPGVDPCTLCLFPPDSFGPTKCATNPISIDSGQEPDSALPFLSYLAGLMTASEILKIGVTPTANRHIITLFPTLETAGFKLSRKSGCACITRTF